MVMVDGFLGDETMEQVIFHIDVNSAYLSWIAAFRLYNGDTVDLRTIPSVVGGDELSRHGIVLAKSMSAKAYGIKTGNPIRTALEQCPHLKIVPPDYFLFQKASNAMVALLKEYSSKIQQFSVDECFLDYTDSQALFGTPMEAAIKISDRIREELGFTVNIGISSNKLLAKMASDFQKPNGIHTLYREEMPSKMWPLPVGDLFMCGRKTTAKLKGLGIHTIGDLAKAPPEMLRYHLKSFGLMLYEYANGVDSSDVRKSNFEVVKGIGNSTTVRFDVTRSYEAELVLLSLVESVGLRLRNAEFCTRLISVSIVTNEFTSSSHQRKIDVATDSTTYMHQIAKDLFRELWDGTSIRKLGVRVSELQVNTYTQQSLFASFNFDKHKRIDGCMDDVRRRYGKRAIQRAAFLHSGLPPVTGGIGEEGYPVMTSIL